MLEIKKLQTLDEIIELRKSYFESSTAPLDGMWHFGFVPMSTHFAFYENDCPVGYCCINDEGYMLQFHLLPTAQSDARELFTLIAQQNSAVIDKVVGAFVSTAEPSYLSLCLDNLSSIKINALMYQWVKPLDVEPKLGVELTVAKQDQLTEFVEFAVASIGAPEQWLKGYFGNLIHRQELFGYWKDGKLLATGECRLFDDYQTEFADLGMIVSPTERGKGIATRVLLSLVSLALARGLTPICSTEASNIGAQKAIKNAGLMTLNRIVQIEFE